MGVEYKKYFGSVCNDFDRNKNVSIKILVEKIMNHSSPMVSDETKELKKKVRGIFEKDGKIMKRTIERIFWIYKNGDEIERVNALRKLCCFFGLAWEKVEKWRESGKVERSTLNDIIKNLTKI